MKKRKHENTTHETTKQNNERGTTDHSRLKIRELRQALGRVGGVRHIVEERVQRMHPLHIVILVHIFIVFHGNSGFFFYFMQIWVKR